jgi:hypothetical protein
MFRWKPAARIALAILVGVLFDWFSGSRWNSWPETITAVIFVSVACFLAGMSVGGATRGPNARAVIILFAVSFLIWPALNGMLRQFPALEFFGILEVLPTLAGGLTGMLLQRSHRGAWWVITAAVSAVSVTAVGPPR